MLPLVNELWPLPRIGTQTVAVLMPKVALSRHLHTIKTLYLKGILQYVESQPILSHPSLLQIIQCPRQRFSYLFHNVPLEQGHNERTRGPCSFRQASF